LGAERLKKKQLIFFIVFNQKDGHISIHTIAFDFCNPKVNPVGSSSLLFTDYTSQKKSQPPFSFTFSLPAGVGETFLVLRLVDLDLLTAPKPLLFFSIGCNPAFLFLVFII
jgi:hypothetical protein